MLFFKKIIQSYSWNNRKKMKIIDIICPQYIREGIKLGIFDTFKYYLSKEYLYHLINTGLTEPEAVEIRDFKMNNINTTEVKPYALNEDRYGDYAIEELVDNYMNVYVNPNFANTEELARETVWHELGGHASTRGYSSEQKELFKELFTLHPGDNFNNPLYNKIAEHTKTILPELKDSWKAYLEGDFDKFKSLATPEELEFEQERKSIDKFIEYINTEQETTARAIAAHIGEYAGQPTKWNLQQLNMFFKPETVEKLKKFVWTIGWPIVICW